MVQLTITNIVLKIKNQLNKVQLIITKDFPSMRIVWLNATLKNKKPMPQIQSNIIINGPDRYSHKRMAVAGFEYWWLLMDLITLSHADVRPISGQYSHYTPWKHQKTKGFLVFSGGIGWEYWPEMG